MLSFCMNTGYNTIMLGVRAGIHDDATTLILLHNNFGVDVNNDALEVWGCYI